MSQPTEPPTGPIFADDPTGSFSRAVKGSPSIPLPWAISMAATGLGLGGGGATLLGAASTEQVTELEDRIEVCEDRIDDLEKQRTLELSQLQNLQETINRTYAIVDKAHPRGD